MASTLVTRLENEILRLPDSERRGLLERLWSKLKPAQESTSRSVEQARGQSELADPSFPHITYRAGAAHWPVPVVRGTGIRVQTLVLAAGHWEMSVAEIAKDYDLDEVQVRDALAFYEAHRHEIDAAIESEERIEVPGA